jgi:hypothetical protein
MIAHSNDCRHRWCYVAVSRRYTCVASAGDRGQADKSPSWYGFEHGDEFFGPVGPTSAEAQLYASVVTRRPTSL